MYISKTDSIQIKLLFQILFINYSLLSYDYQNGSLHILLCFEILNFLDIDKNLCKRGGNVTGMFS